MYLEHELLKGQEKKKETIPKIGINFMRDFCPKAVMLLYPKIKETAQKPEVQFEIFGNTMKFSASPSKVCTASPVIITFRRREKTSVKNRMKISVGEKRIILSVFFKSSAVLSSSSL